MPGRVQGTNTIFFIKKSKIPPNRCRDVTYGCIICDYHEGKTEWNQTWLTKGGDKINYPKDCGMPTADLLTMKLLNSVISTHNAKFMTIDIKNFYLNTQLKRCKYLWLKLDDIPKKVTQQYALADNATDDGWVYVKIWNRMYGFIRQGY